MSNFFSKDSLKLLNSTRNIFIFVTFSTTILVAFKML